MQHITVGHMITDMLRDFSQPEVVWQLVALACCLMVAWGVALWLGKRIAGRYQDSDASLQFAAQGLSRSVFPLTGWLLILGVRAVLAPWLPTSVLSLALVPLFGIGFLYGAFYVIRRILSDSVQLSHMLGLIEKILTTLVWIGMVLYVLGLLEDVLVWLNSIEIRLGGKTPVSLLAIGSGMLWVLVTLLFALWLGAWLDSRLMRAQGLDNNLKVVLSRFSKAVLILIAVLFSLSLVGIDLTVLSVFGGALGVGLGLGLQEIASNYVAGFIILLDRSLRIGDLITVDKFAGAVTQIRTRYTVLKAGDGVESLIPNKMMVSSVVQNHSFTETKVRLVVSIQVAYQSDVEHVMQLLLQAAQMTDRVLADPVPSVALTRFADNGIEFELGFWIEDARDGKLNVQSAVNLQIWRLFRQYRVEIPYPQCEVRFLGPLSIAAESGEPPSSSASLLSQHGSN